MPDRAIQLIVIHCAASVNGVSLARTGNGDAARTAAQVIDGWHAKRDFKRQPEWVAQFNPKLLSIGYHYVIDTDGHIETGRHVNERGAHVEGNNYNSLGICMVGTDKFSAEQWVALRGLVRELLATYPKARVCGHRELSPDRNGDGKITPDEFVKICPGFNVTEWWLSNGMNPMAGHVFGKQS